MKQKHSVCGEFALVLAVVINSFGVVLMLYSGSGISAISSAPYASSEVLTRLSLGTWTYIFQELLDEHKAWMTALPVMITWKIVYFIINYVLISIGIALSNRCGLQIVPTDLFPRELADITGVAYSKIKVAFDVICLAITALLTGLALGHIKGLGIGTVIAAFTMGRFIGLIGKWTDKHFCFETAYGRRHSHA